MYLCESEKIDIGKKIFTHKLTKSKAKEIHNLSEYDVVSCVKAYMKSENIPIIPEVISKIDLIENKDYKSMTNPELVKELMMKDIEIARLKKGYVVKGGGSRTKEFSILKDLNSK